MKLGAETAFTANLGSRRGLRSAIATPPDSGRARCHPRSGRLGVRFESAPWCTRPRSRALPTGGLVLSISPGTLGSGAPPCVSPAVGSPACFPAPSELPCEASFRLGSGRSGTHRSSSLRRSRSPQTRRAFPDCPLSAVVICGVRRAGAGAAGEGLRARRAPRTR
ncbi:hypothetical protein GGR52DRAFT_549308 [Hypoxylon sp. FL1284]|nr:hypothetical protein GGR52DRAFT_549308 [Hypoxylon sp. FL1284]